MRLGSRTPGLCALRLKDKIDFSYFPRTGNQRTSDQAITVRYHDPNFHPNLPLTDILDEKGGGAIKNIPN